MIRNTAALASLEILETDRLGDETNDAFTDFAPSPHSFAFLQYTSGSTSEPKGTLVTHENIMANQRMLERAFHNDRHTVIATWLPIFHDMGLIGNVLHAAYLGARAVLVSTLGFIKDPMLWLRTIQRHRADFSGGPNFAYDLCVSKTTPDQRRGLDLSSWRAAFNGSEPVRRHTLERFSATFEPFGFRRDSFVPTYGLAEATLVVSCTPGRAPRCIEADARRLESNVVAPVASGGAALSLVSSGRFDHGDQTVAIVNPTTLRRCPPSEVGEIWISGSHVAAGYWQNPAATERTFAGSLPGDGRRYLRTGDLGFVADGELYVTGRIKDIIIFRGRKLHPQDIELTLELACPRLRPGCTAAFAVGSDDASGIVVVAELDAKESDVAELLPELARRVQEEHEVPVSQLVLVPRNSVPKTTSGKLRRQACKLLLERGECRLVAEWQNPALLSNQAGAEVTIGDQAIIDYASAWVGRMLGLPADGVNLHASLTALGIDSVNKVALASALERRFGIAIPESSFFVVETLNDLVLLAAHCNARASASGPISATPDREKPPAPVLPAFSAIDWRGKRD